MCDKVYTKGSSLQTHQKITHGKAPVFNCPECAYKSNYKHILKRHMKRYHSPGYTEGDKVDDQQEK